MCLLEVGLLSLCLGLVLQVELLVLCDLLLELCKGGLKLRLLQNLGLLIGIDLTGINQVIETLAWVCSEDIVDFGGIGLE